MGGRAQVKHELFEQFAQVGKALANAKRLEILDILGQGERSVEALAQAVGLKLTTTSSHLQVLRQGGVVQSRKQGTRVLYRLAGDGVARLFVDLREVAGSNLAGTERAARAYLGSDELEPVDRETLVSRLRQGGLALLDVRPPDEFAAGHIEGAVSIPLDELIDRVAELPPELEVVAYCRGAYCVFAYEAVRRLRRNGRPARRMSGGMLEWRAERRPVAALPRPAGASRPDRARALMD
jgi:DNA-binding transcriptional ArsR family regulator/rhodanese-related sulfurtransferase